MKVTIEAATLSRALRDLTPLAKLSSAQRRRGCGGDGMAVLACVHIVADANGCVTLSATDLDTFAAVRLEGAVDVPGFAAVPLTELTEMVKRADRGAQVSLAFDQAESLPRAAGVVGRVSVIFGRARFVLPAYADFPVFAVGTHGEGWQEVDCPETFACPIAGRVIPEKASKLWRAVVYKRELAQDATVRLFDQPDAPDWKRGAVIMADVGPWSIRANCFKPEPGYGEKRAPAFHNPVGTYTDAAGEVQTLRTNERAQIELSAAQVAALCGDPSEWNLIDIPAVEFFQGQAVPAGWKLPPMPKAAARGGAQWALVMTPAERKLYLEACRPYPVAGFPDGDIRTAFHANMAAGMRLAEACALALPPVEVEKAPEPVEATIEPATRESLPTAAVEAVAPVSEPMGTDQALANRVAVLEAALARMGVALTMPAAAPPARASREARERIVRAYLRMRTQRALDTAALADLGQRLDDAAAMRAEIADQAQFIAELSSALTDERDRASRTFAANAVLRANLEGEQRNLASALGQVHNMGERLQGSARRADRLARAAVDQRRKLSRMTADLAGARAEAKAHARRADDARSRFAAANPSPMPPAPTNTAMAHAFASAR